MAEKPKFVFSKFYKYSALFVLVIMLIVMPVYPEMFLRFIVAIILGLGVFFGFGTNEAHCEYVYSYIKIKIFRWRWALGCPPRMFAILLSIVFYILAVYVGFKFKIL
jgi:hypothetical protein